MNNESKILNQCLSQEQLLNYLNKNLGISESKTCEMHFTDCEICSDAIDALYPLSLEERTALLNFEANEKPNSLIVSHNKKRIWQAAAGLFLLFSIGLMSYYFINNNATKKEFVVNNKTKDIGNNISSSATETKTAIESNETIKKVAVDSTNSINEIKSSPKPAAMLSEKKVINAEKITNTNENNIENIIPDAKNVDIAKVPKELDENKDAASSTAKEENEKIIVPKPSTSTTQVKPAIFVDNTKNENYTQDAVTIGAGRSEHTVYIVDETKKEVGKKKFKSIKSLKKNSLTHNDYKYNVDDIQELFENKQYQMVIDILIQKKSNDKFLETAAKNYYLGMSYYHLNNMSEAEKYFNIVRAMKDKKFIKLIDDQIK